MLRQLRQALRVRCLGGRGARWIRDILKLLVLRGISGSSNGTGCRRRRSPVAAVGDVCGAGTAQTECITAIAATAAASATTAATAATTVTITSASASASAVVIVQRRQMW